MQIWKGSLYHGLNDLFAFNAHTNLMWCKDLGCFISCMELQICILLNPLLELYLSCMSYMVSQVKVHWKKLIEPKAGFNAINRDTGNIQISAGFI